MNIKLFTFHETIYYYIKIYQWLIFEYCLKVKLLFCWRKIINNIYVGTSQRSDCKVLKEIGSL